MNKKNLGNTISAGGSIFTAISGFAIFITGMIYVGQLPHVRKLCPTDAEKLANTIARNMGYSTEIKTVFGQSYRLYPYDNLHYQLTNHLPLDKFTAYDSYGDYYYRPDPLSSSSDYVISPEACDDPSKKALANQFNAPYNEQVYNKTHFAGNPKAAHNSEKALIALGAIFTVCLVISIISCCWSCPCENIDDNKQQNSKENKQSGNQVEGGGSAYTAQ